MTKSALQIARAAYQPKLPKGLKGTVKAVAGAATQSVADQEEIKKLFPNTYGMPLIKFENTDETVDFPAMNVGVILSGGQAPGGHNVISGIFDGIKKLNKDSKLYGFILGPGGLVDHNYMELTSSPLRDTISSFVYSFLFAISHFLSYGSEEFFTYKLYYNTKSTIL